MQLPKNIQAQIENMEQRRAIEARDERTKRQITENQDAIEFWIATARHWQKRASFLEGVAQREKDTATHAVTEMQAQAMERDHWKRAAEQNHGDVMAAEGRTDAMGDILDALARGWRMESYDGCAKWWRYDTDTLAALAKEAREWEQGEDSKPLTQIYIGAGEGEPFTMGDQQFVPQDDPKLATQEEHDTLIGLLNQHRGEPDHDGESWIVWEWGYKPADVAETDTVEIKTIADLRNVLEASVIDWEQVTAYRVIRANPIATASPVADAGAVMAEVGEAVAQADGFNGHMIGTDGDRVGFIWHATKYGFKSEYNPESATSAQIEDDYNRAFAYMQKNGHPLK